MSILLSDNTFFTSDLHLGHKLLSGLRGFNSIQDHDRAVMKNLYALPEGATLFIGGDISVRKDQEALTMLARLKRDRDLTLLLTPGNHDKVHPMFGADSVIEHEKMYREVFDSISLDYTAGFGNKAVIFTHIPEFGDEHRKAKLLRFRARSGFDVVVHGHTHSSEVFSPHGRHVNLCVEAHDLKPISSRTLRDYIGRAAKMK